MKIKLNGKMYFEEINSIQIPLVYLILFNKPIYGICSEYEPKNESKLIKFEKKRD